MDSQEMKTVTLANYLGQPMVAEKIKKLKKMSQTSKLLTKSSLEVRMLTQMIESERPRESFKDLRNGMKSIGKGIYKKTITEGYGDRVERGLMIMVHFTLIFKTDKEISNSTLFPKRPYSYVVGKTNGVLPGFDLAILSMQNQEKAHFVIPHQLLYGENGMLPEIPPRQDGYLIAEVTRVFGIEYAVEKYKKQLSGSFTQTMVRVEEIRGKAKEAFNAKSYKVALDKYTEAIYLLNNVKVENEAEDDQHEEALAQIHLNGAIVFNKMELPEMALKMLEKPSELIEAGFVFPDSFKGKLFLHLGRTLRLQGEFSKAWKKLQEAKDFIGEEKIQEEVQNLFKEFKESQKNHALLDEQTMIASAVYYDVFTD